jgi:hypothetical protein
METTVKAPAPPYLILLPRDLGVCAPNLRSEFGKKKRAHSSAGKRKTRFYWTLPSFISVLQSILYALADPRVLAACFIIHRSKKDDPS